MREREQFKSRIGFILLSAGCAIGIGNVWRFPYVVGENGGGIFVLFYLFFLLLIGVPILSMEFSVGRASKKSVVPSFRKNKSKMAFTWLYVIGWKYLFNDFLYDSFRMDVKIFL